MSKYYSKHGDKLYIYVTNNEQVINIDLFSRELEIDVSSTKKTSKRYMVILSDIDEITFDRIEILLSLYDYKRQDLSEQVLLEFYDTGDVNSLLEELPEGSMEKPKTKTSHNEKIKIRPRPLRHSRIQDKTQEKNNKNNKLEERTYETKQKSYDQEIIIPPVQSPSNLQLPKKEEHDKTAQILKFDSSEEIQIEKNGRPVDEEELISLLAEYIKTQELVRPPKQEIYKKEKEPIEHEKTSSENIQKIEKRVETLLDTIDILLDLIKKERLKSITNRESQMNDLMKQLQAYIQNITPQEKKPSSLIDELIKNLTEYVRLHNEQKETPSFCTKSTNTTSTEQINGEEKINHDFKSGEEKLKGRLSDYIKKSRENGQPIRNKEVNRYIIDFVKSRIIVTGIENRKKPVEDKNIIIGKNLSFDDLTKLVKDTKNEDLK
jgi:hypothetical protein